MSKDSMAEDSRADIHLYRAAFFHQIQPYPWDSHKADAKAARQLIEKHGYLRRLPDLQVVEANLPTPPAHGTANGCN